MKNVPYTDGSPSREWVDDGMKITKEMLAEIVRIESLDENEWDEATVEFERRYGVTTAEVGIEMIRRVYENWNALENILIYEDGDYKAIRNIIGVDDE